MTENKKFERSHLILTMLEDFLNANSSHTDEISYKNLFRVLDEFKSVAKELRL